MNKSAKEMFEELGYKLMKEDDKEIWYVNKNTKPVATNITFIVQLKYFVIYKHEIDNPCIDVKELQAINQQINELGWLDE